MSELKEFIHPQHRSSSFGPKRRQKRDEALRAENADVDDLAREYGLTPKTVGIIKYLKEKRRDAGIKPGVKTGIKAAIIREWHTNIRTVNYWVERVAPELVGQAIDNPGQSRRAPPSHAERKILLIDLFQDPRPTKQSLVEKHGIAGFKTISHIVLQYWIPKTSSEKIFDVTLCLKASQEMVQEYLAGTPALRRTVEKQAKRPSIISQIDGFIPWPRSGKYRIAGAAFNHFLREEGIDGLDDFLSRTERDRFLTVKKMPEQVFLAFQLALAGRVATLNRGNVRLFSKTGISEPTPGREQLEAITAKLISENRISAADPLPDLSPFAEAFHDVFPTLAKLIPAKALENEDTLWRSVSDLWPNQEQFGKELKRLLSTKQICDPTGINVDMLLMTFVMKFAPGKSKDDALPEFADQRKKMGDLRAKCKEFARLIELASGKLNDAGSVAIDRNGLQTALGKKAKTKPIVSKALSLYSMATCPVVDGALTQEALDVMDRMNIPHDKVAEIFEKELTTASDESKQRPTRPAREKHKAPELIPVPAL